MELNVYQRGLQLRKNGLKIYKIMETNKKYATLSLSGGMDSSTLLLHLLYEGYNVTALSFDYGQKHKVELECATALVKYINENHLRIFHHDHAPNGFEESYPLVKHQIIKLDGLSSLLNSSLVEGGDEVPEGHYEASNMDKTVVPNRNKIFSSIIQAVALSIAEKYDTECVIAMGIHAGDHAIYPDCRQEFRDADFEAFKLGNWGAEKIHLYTPYLKVSKYEILQDGVDICEGLGLDFDSVYMNTNTSYKPIWIGEFDSMNQPSEKTGWYSDYKSASSVERIEAFIKLGVPDPVKYADESGPVSWETAKNHVIKILDEHAHNTMNN
jgi:7-cyano-7-deazaguanine synthase